MGRTIVYLVGAGPGDAGLFTLKGVECMRRADVVVYDYLVNPRLLSYAPEDAELVYVGKRGFAEHLTQDEVNAILVEKARAGGGRTVVRLKGGDPFVFGRGGEEALVLAEAGIPFEVVPGVSSGHAAPAYAGIPVTQRGVTTEVSFVTGHEDPAREVSGIDWEHLAQGKRTICFFMGVKNLEAIVEQLVAHGRPADSPIALVRWGTTPRQETLTGTLADIVGKVRETGFAAPAIIVVGEVVKLRDKLQWFEGRPLFGKTVVVTRAREQASDLIGQLEEQGAEVLAFPTIRTVDPESWRPIDEAIRNIEVYRWIVFTSVNAVHRFFDRLELADKDGRSMASARVAAVGPATAAACIERGIRPDFVPEDYRAEGVIDGFCARGLGAGTRVLLPRALEAREILPDTLAEQGAIVDVVPVYRTVLGQGDPAVLERLAEGTVDAVTFTSSSTVRNFLELLRDLDPQRVLEDVLLASIGPVTSETIRSRGLTVGVEAEESTVPSLAQALISYFTASR